MTAHDRYRLGIVVKAAALLLWSVASVGAEPLQVHDGMTPRQLVDFAEQQGWRAEASETGANVVIHAGDESIHVKMMDCDNLLCASGLISRITYYTIESPRGACNLWHWNLEARGATGFGAQQTFDGESSLSYVTLQRYLRFRGVTDQYLRDVVDIWLKASPPFWELVKQCAAPERDEP